MFLALSLLYLQNMSINGKVKLLNEIKPVCSQVPFSIPFQLLVISIVQLQSHEISNFEKVVAIQSLDWTRLLNF